MVKFSNEKEEKRKRGICHLCQNEGSAYCKLYLISSSKSSPTMHFLRRGN